MNTRCPKCRTTFAVTDAQLQARGGVVRCGHCGQVFRADHHRVRKLPPTPRPARPKSSRDARARRAAEPVLAGGGSAPAGTAGERRLPTIEELLTGGTRARTRTIFWVAGNSLAAAALLAQVIHFYANNIVNWRQWTRPYVESACAVLNCTVQARIDTGLIEITASGVAPHPRYVNALLLRATMINRAEFAQPYPLMEVSITNRHGTVIGRRVFPPKAYLAGQTGLPTDMIPNLVVRARLEFTSPGDHADGYEIRLLPDRRVPADEEPEAEKLH
jgi:predicted Zn finger-like uncharacterized protein